MQGTTPTDRRAVGRNGGHLLRADSSSQCEILYPDTWHTLDPRLRLRHPPGRIRYQRKGSVGQVGTRFSFDPINAPSSARGFEIVLRPFGSLAPPRQTRNAKRTRMVSKRSIGRKVSLRPGKGWLRRNFITEIYLPS